MIRGTLLGFLFSGVLGMNVDAAVRIEKTEYEDWQNCYRVINGEVELIVTGDVGPRVIRFGFVGGQSFCEEFSN